MSMDDLPSEIFLRIFSMLDYRHLACVAQVCRKWSYRSEQADLWQPLYEQRWGKYNPSKFKSWKAAYEASDRCERIGMDMNITREGLDYFLVHEGKLLRFLGTCNNKQRESVKNEEEKQQVQVPSVIVEKDDTTSQEGLVDKLLFFLGDLEYATRQQKKNRVS